MIPFARPLASDSPAPKVPLTAQMVARNANDSHALSRAVGGGVIRLSPRRLADLSTSLSVRDRAIIATLSEFRLASSAHLQRLHFRDGTHLSNLRRCRDSLKRLTDLRVLHRLDRRVGGIRSGSSGFVYALDVAGLRLAGATNRPQRPTLPSLPYLAHVLAVTELGVRLREASRDRFEILALSGEPSCWRQYVGSSGTRIFLKPDLFVQVLAGQDESAFFVEVDLATESATALARKFERYHAYFRSGREEHRLGYFPRVLWLVPSERRKAVLLDVAAKQPADSWALHLVKLYDEALDVIGEVTP